MSNLTIGFANQYYTLWSVTEEANYVTDAYGNSWKSQQWNRFTYIKNVSKDLEKVKELYPNTSIDDGLRGKSISFDGQKSPVLPEGYFWFGKYYGHTIEEVIETDFNYCLWAIDNTHIKGLEDHPKVLAHFKAQEEAEAKRISEAKPITVGTHTLTFTSNGFNAWWSEYNLLLEVGAGETFGGTTYYYSAQVPVKQLLPLSTGQDLLAVDLGVQEYEGWSYRDVRYYVDDGDTPGEFDGDPNGWDQGDEYDTGLWDVFWMQNYVWTEEGAVETAAPWLQVRDAGDGVLAIPELFTDNPSRTDLVLAVNTELDTVVDYFDEEGIIDPAFLERVDADFDIDGLDDLTTRSGFAALD